jgi:hypothetical protein
MKPPAPKGLPIIVACALLGGPIAANASPYVVTLEETAPGVVATGSGAIDLTGLVLDDEPPIPGVGQLNPSSAVIAIGVTDLSGPNLIQYLDIIGPTSFGSGVDRVADDGTGDVVDICGACNSLYVPVHYVSDTLLSNTSTYEGQDFASLGVTPGTYKWTWGTGADQSFTLKVGEAGAIPEPATLPLFAGGLGFVVYLTRRRKEAAPVAA